MLKYTAVEKVLWSIVLLSDYSTTETTSACNSGTDFGQNYTDNGMFDNILLVVMESIYLSD